MSVNKCGLTVVLLKRHLIVIGWTALAYGLAISNGDQAHILTGAQTATGIHTISNGTKISSLFLSHRNDVAFCQVTLAALVIIDAIILSICDIKLCYFLCTECAFLPELDLVERE